MKPKMDAFDRYCEREGIDQEVARDTEAFFEKYVYDYSTSHGPELSVRALHGLVQRLLDKIDKLAARKAGAE